MTEPAELPHNALTATVMLARDLAQALWRAEQAEAACSKLRRRAQAEVQEYRALWLELALADEELCPYCGELDRYVTLDGEELEPCASCRGRAECRDGEGIVPIVGCPTCLGCDAGEEERFGFKIFRSGLVLDRRVRAGDST